jgi:hypothetical protein
MGVSSEHGLRFGRLFPILALIYWMPSSEGIFCYRSEICFPTRSFISKDLSILWRASQFILQNYVDNYTARDLWLS